MLAVHRRLVRPPCLCTIQRPRGRWRGLRCLLLFSFSLMLNVRVLFLFLCQIYLLVSFDGQFAFCVCRLLGNGGKFFHFFISAPNDEADDGCAQKEGEPKDGFCLVWVEHLFLFCVFCFVCRALGGRGLPLPWALPLVLILSTTRSLQDTYNSIIFPYNDVFSFYLSLLEIGEESVFYEKL